MKRKTTIIRCHYCGKYFEALRSDALYCDRIVPGHNNKTCKEVGANQKFEAKLKTDKAEYIRRNTDLALRMRMRRHPDSLDSKEALKNWQIRTAQLKTAVKKGTKTYEEYLEWLTMNSPTISSAKRSHLGGVKSLWGGSRRPSAPFA